MIKKHYLIAVAAVLLTNSLFAQNFPGEFLSYNTLCMAKGDIDGDGDIDIAVGGLRSLSWEENKGNNVFENHVISHTQPEVQGIVVVDLDQDGYMDIVTASLSNNTVYWCRNAGNNVFSQTALSSSTAGSADIDVADMDNDGDLDIVGAAFTGDKVYMLQNNGSQTFTLIDLAINIDGAIKSKIADFDGDGDKDIVVGAREGDQIFWLRNNGTTTFTNINIANIDAPRDIKARDYDQDGDMDIMYASDGGWGWYKNTNAAFAQNAYGVNAGVRGIEIGDVNNDGNNDVMIASYTNEYISYSIGSSTQTISGGAILDQTINTPSLIIAADFNQDGRLDVLGGSSQDVRLNSNGVGQVFTTIQISKYLGNPFSLCQGDFDNDGDQDLMGIGSLNLMWYRNEENGEFTPIRMLDSVNNQWIYTSEGIYIRSADMDGDGDTDVVYSSNSGDNVYWIENHGGGAFEDHFAFYLDGSYGAEPMDFDQDGDMDIIATSTASGNVFWYENDGAMTFSQHLVSANYLGPFQARGFDYDVDGDNDIIVAFGTSDRVVIFTNSGNNTTFTAYVIDSSAPGANSVYMIDIDDDGDVDILSSTSDDDRVNLYKNDGDPEYPGYTKSSVATGVDFSTYVFADDYDGDGDIDVVSSSLEDYRMDILFNDGTESFSRVALATQVYDAHFIESGDLDGDGLPEIYGIGNDHGLVEVFKKQDFLPPPPVELNPCADLFISEYVEGSSFNKAIEIYNPTGANVNLANYIIEVYSNGGTQASQSASMFGTLVPYDVYVIAHNSSDPEFLGVADIDFGFSFNGDDAIVLKKNGVIIDQIGVIGQDPGTGWAGTNGSNTIDKTLVRKSTITQGNNSTSQTFDAGIEWDVYPNNAYQYIGFHDGICANACVASIAITATSADICSGTSVTFNATIVEGGSNPIYQWYKNNNPVGTNSASYTDSNLADNDIVKCTLTTDASCAISASVTSNVISINVNPTAAPTIAITTTTPAICSGSLVTFTATISNGGTIPMYQWKKNGSNEGTGTNNFIASGLVNGDIITCVLTSNAPCVTSTTATSNAITITVSSSVTPTISISASSTSICPSTSVTFTANATNGGATPTYQWKKNGSNVGTNSATYTASSWVNGDVITCVFTTSAACPTVANVTSNSVTLTVSSAVTPSVSLSASATSTCANGLLVFTGFPSNGGSSPSYVWYVNGSIVSTNGNGYSASSWTNGTQVYVTMNSSVACPTATTVTSNIVTITVNPTVTPTCAITATSSTICSGTNVTFNATNTNGGTTPSYQWKKNGGNVGTNSTTYSSTTLVNGDVITCVMTSNAPCPTSATATSNAVTMTVNASVTPSVSIAASQTTICGTGSITFTATPANQGPTPTYQWKKNGSNVGTNSATYTSSSWNNGDIVTCVLTGSLPCGTSNVTSNAVTITVSSQVTPTISISTPSNSICTGTSPTFTATITNGGSSPSYAWQLNGSTVSTSGNTYTNPTLQTGDQIKCILTSNASCISASTANSNIITMTVNSSVTPTLFIGVDNDNICQGTSVTFNAGSTNGGTTPTYQWKKNGGNVGTNSTSYTSSTLANNDVITCVMTSNATCATVNSVTSNAITMVVNPIVTPTISIEASATSICGIEEISFTATPANGGSNPSYQWKKNGNNVGANSPIFSNSSWINGDIVTCTITGSATCGLTSAISNAITIEVGEVVTPTITIDASSNSICQGDEITFVSIGIGGGANPVYQWYSNGTPIGTNSSVLNWSDFQNGDEISCTMTSSIVCATGEANSNIQTIVVSNLSAPLIINNNGILETALVNGASYQWYWNTQIIDGATSSTYTPTQSGLYHVEVTLGGCFETSSQFIFNYIGIEELTNEIEVYPNPSSNYVTIQSSTALLQTEIYNELGQRIMMSKESTISVNHLASGMYVLKITTTNNQHYQKIQITH